jgi:hypothetical protein
MDLVQIIYTSQPFGFDDATLNNVLLDARRCNDRDDITGALLCRQDIYLQLLEGPEPAVQAAYKRIENDDRHLDIVLRSNRSVTERLFGRWAMLHDPARTKIWSREDIGKGALDRASEADFRDVFTKLAAQVAAD